MYTLNGFISCNNEDYVTFKPLSSHIYMFLTRCCFSPGTHSQGFTPLSLLLRSWPGASVWGSSPSCGTRGIGWTSVLSSWRKYSDKQRKHKLNGIRRTIKEARWF